MLEPDAEAISRLARRNAWLNPSSVLGPSAEVREESLCWELWNVGVTPVPEGGWNLDEPAPTHLRGHGLALICNTFMCSRDPFLWLRNVAQATDFLIVQDLATCSRQPGRWCAVETGDRQRYSVSTHGVFGTTDSDLRPVFDLSTCGVVVLDCEPYDANENGSYQKFVALLDLRPLRDSRESNAPWYASIIPWLVPSTGLAQLVESL